MELPNKTYEIYGNIESDIIFKKILSFLNNRKKLSLIVYNKTLQKKFDINIKDYKRESKIIKIAEKNGKGKEFLLNTDKLIFEGEYKNGKRWNGIEKKYFNDEVILESEYSNGRRTKGFGKEYNK